MESCEYDFNRICRTCKNESNELCSVFDALFGQNARIDEMLMACASVQVSNTDGLPSCMCTKCLNILTTAFDFKQLCERTDSSLRDYLKSKGIKQEGLNQNNENDLQNQLLDFSAMYNEISQQSNNQTKTQTQLEPGEIIKTEPQPNNKDFVEIVDNDKVIFTCVQCSKCFYTLEGLKSHKRVHTGELFKCNICNKEYTRLNHLQRHMASHGRRKVHICKICNKTLTRLEHLKRHLITHMKNKPYQCELCKRGFNRSEHLMNHAKRCKGDKIYACEVCNKGFTRMDSLEVHMRLHDNRTPILPTIDTLDNIQDHYIEVDDYSGRSESEHSDNDNFSDHDDGLDQDETEDRECFEPQVDILENSDENSQTHVKTEPNLDENSVHINDNEATANETLEEEDQNGDIIAAAFIDDDDDFRMDDNDSDSTHSEYLPSKAKAKAKPKRGRPKKNKEKSESTDKPEKKKKERKTRQKAVKEEIEVIKQEIKEEEQELEEEEFGEFPCLVCNKVLSTKAGLEIHIRKHTGLKLYECKDCDKKFTRSNHLKRHMNVHNENKPYSCTICPKTFSRRDHMTQHMKLHNENKEFECEVCNRPFSREEHLLKHKASKHNIGTKIMNEKKFKCTVCGKGFTTEKYRDVHMRGHNGEKKFQCKVCEKTFISKSHLTEHMKFHNDHSKKFLCSECGQRFIRNDYLVIHMRRHRGEKPFKCRYCGKGFPRTTDLTVHERYHTGEKTHLCTICGRGFGRAYNLTVHMRTHTGEKPYQCTYCDAAFAQGNDLKAHVRRHTGERFHCEICSESFLMGYLLTQHKRTVHGLQVVSHIRRLQQFPKIQDPAPPHLVQQNQDNLQVVSLPQPSVHPPSIVQQQASIQPHTTLLSQQSNQQPLLIATPSVPTLVSTLPPGVIPNIPLIPPIVSMSQQQSTVVD